MSLAIIKANITCFVITINLLISYYHLGALVRLNAAFGQGSGPVVFSGVTCSGVESSLIHCPREFTVINTCAHTLDAGVVCLSGRYLCIECFYLKIKC